MARGAGTFGADGADAEADETAGGEAFEVDFPVADSTGGELFPDGGHGGLSDRDDLHFVELSVGYGAPAGAQLAGVAGGLRSEVNGGGHGGGGTRGASQGPAGTEEGFPAPVVVFTGHGGGAQLFLAIGHCCSHGGPDGFYLLFQGSEGAQRFQLIGQAGMTAVAGRSFISD